MRNFRTILAALLAAVLLCGCASPGNTAVTTGTVPVFTEAAEGVWETAPDETAPAPLPASEAAPDQAAVHGDGIVVSTVDQLLAAIAPNTRIFLAEGTYDLGLAKNYAREGTFYYHWESVYDGYELVITNVPNLEIIGLNDALVTISAQPRYANVLSFRDCENLVLADVIIGHTQEPGSCSGGVLYFDRCENVEVNSCSLYGCGIRGVDAIDCKAIRVIGSEIFDCSYGAAYIERCWNVLFENCRVHDCSDDFGLFEIQNSAEIAVINSEIFRNRGGWGSLVASNSKGVYFGGLDVHDNSFYTVFDLSVNPITVEYCRFQNDFRLWYDELGPLRFDGKTLPDGELSRMEMRTVTWEAEPLPDEILSIEGEDGKIHVSTVDEFLAAIRSDVTIYLEPGDYLLNTASGYGGMGGSYYRWDNTVDGPALTIRNVQGLTIEGSGIGATKILAAPRYADVLRFENCDDLNIKALTAGHTEEPGQCSGGVLDFANCSGVRIEFCSLFGCGILGISGSQTRHMDVYATEIYDCSFGAVWLYNCHYVTFRSCDIHDNGPDTFFITDGSTNVTLDGEPLT